MIKWRKNGREASGQAILLVALMMVVLLGFTGLAIDGGSLFWLQRQAQNAVDAALLAAIYEMCSTETPTFADVRTAALSAAAANNFNNDGVDNTVTVNSPPTQGGAAGNSEYVEVIIWADAPTYLIQMVYWGPTEVTVRGVGQCRPERVALADYSFLSLAESGNKVFDFSGNAEVNFCGGGIASNYDAETSNNAVPTVLGSFDLDDWYTDATEHDPITCDTPKAQSAAGWTNSSKMSTAGFDTSGVNNGQTTPDPFASVAPPVNTDAANCNSNGTIDDGTFNISGTMCFEDIDCGPQDEVFIIGNPARDDNVVYVTGDMDIQCEFTATDVLIYVVGNVDMNAQANSRLVPATNGGPWDGFMLWSTGSSASCATMNGGSDSFWVGTMYFPNTCVSVNGGANSVYIAQIIAQTVDFAGGADSVVVYNEDYFFHLPPTLTVNE